MWIQVPLETRSRQAPPHQSHLIKSGVSQSSVDALRQSSDKKYECTTCGYKTNRKPDFDKHLPSARHLRKSGAAKRYKCSPCSYETSSKTRFDRHQASEMHLEKTGATSSRKRDFECVPRAYTTKEKREYEKHLLSVTHYKNNLGIPKPQPPYYCKHCDYGTTIERDLQRHNVSPKHLKNSGATSTTPPSPTYKCLPCSESLHGHAVRATIAPLLRMRFGFIFFLIVLPRPYRKH